MSVTGAVVRGLRRLGTLLAVAIWAAGNAAAGDVTMEVTPEVARAMARQALDQGNADLAARIAAQLLAADPNDLTALLVQTAALSQLGQGQAAVASGRLAYHLAHKAGPAQRFEAAYLTAGALSAADQPGRAKWWLRRADTYSPGAEEDALLQNAFRQLDARTPLSFNLAVGFGPSNNVNGGSLHDTFYFWGIPIPIAQALPGWVGNVSGQVSYRLVRKSDVAVTLFAKARHRQVWLSDRAHALDATAKAADYASDGLDLGASAQWAVGQNSVINLSGQVGRRWYGFGGQGQSQQLELGFARAFDADRMARIDLTLGGIQQDHHPRSNSVRASIEASYSDRLGSGKVSYHLGLTNTNALAAGVANRSITAGADWQPDALIKGLDLTFFTEAEATDFWRAPTPTPDVRLDVGVAAQINKATVMGFAPTVSLTASRSYSDVVVRDTFDMGLSVGLQSSF